MLTSVVRRWNGGRAVYRPARETIRTSDYEVAEILQDGPAKAYIQGRHYSGSYPAARWRFGLYRHGQLVGVAVFSQPVNNATLNVLPGDLRTELGRFVLDDDVEANGESWMIARCFELLRKIGVTGVVSHSDPVARTALDGELVFPGHLGVIYMATNARYLGRATARTLRLLPDGRVLSDRALQKIRAGDCGWRYAVQELVAAGAAPLQDFESRRQWLGEWLPKVTRPLRHPGNHRYVWALNSRDFRHLPAAQPYPKLLPQNLRICFT